MEISTDGLVLTGLDRINVILGKNGCGKSTLLKKVSAYARTHADEFGRAAYITPERSGTLEFSQNVESNARSNKTWLDTSREVNQQQQFKQQTVYQFDTLQYTVLQRFRADVEAGLAPPSMDPLARINTLLDNIEVREIPNSRGFQIFHLGGGYELRPDQISSGESELISLAIECLSFAILVRGDIPCLLVMDEPDVHLHPDLQARLMNFLNSLVEEFPMLNVLMATHSTAILGELSRYEHTTVSPMVTGQVRLEFESIDDAYRRVLPVFGAHPLTSIFRESPILLVEGTDEDRIWDQALRTSKGAIRFYPVDTRGVSNMSEYEDRVLKITDAIYEGAVSYSLRDRDEGTEDIEDQAPLVRMKLSCRAAENLLLSNEVLARAGTTWAEVGPLIQVWLNANAAHSKAAVMQAFVDGGLDRKRFDLKEIRMILIADILDSNKPWEFLVGQTIGMLTAEQLATTSEGSLADYLGYKLRGALTSMVSLA